MARGAAAQAEDGRRRVNVPPDFGGTEIEEGVEEDLGLPPQEHHAPAEPEGYERARADHEAHAPGQTCVLCGTVIAAGQNVRHRADGMWVHEVCPLPGQGQAGETGLTGS
jgi:hypothetical protein